MYSKRSPGAPLPCDQLRVFGRSAAATVDRFVAFMDEVGVPHTLSAAGIPTTSEELAGIADDIVAHGCDAEGNLPSIQKIGRAGILEILSLAK